MGAIFKKRKENPYARISSKVAGKNRVEKSYKLIAQKNHTKNGNLWEFCKKSP